MAAPTFVAASTGTTDTTGAWTHTSAAPGAAGRLLIVQLLQDGVSASPPTITSVTNAENIAGTDNVLTFIGSFDVGSAVAAKQLLWAGRSLSTSAMVITGANVGGDDVYVRVYEFDGVNTGTELSDIFENGDGTFLINQTAADVIGQFGQVTTRQQRAQSFTGAGPVTKFSLWTDVGGTPTDDAIFEIQTDSAGSPSGAVLASLTVPVASLTLNGYTDWPIAMDFTVGTTYWIVARRSGSLSNTNFYHWYADQFGDPYAGGVIKEMNSGAWTVVLAGATDAKFNMVGVTSTGAGTSTTISDAVVTIMGEDRLVLNFVAANDDIALDAFTGTVGGTWTEAVAEYADSGGTDGALQLQLGNLYELNLPTGGTIVAFGFQTTNSEKQAQSFTATSTMTSQVQFHLQKQLAPADNAVVQLQADSSGNPSGTPLGTDFTAAGATITTGAGGTLFTHDFGVSLTPSSVYWLVFQRSGALSATDYYRVLSTTEPYSGGQAKVFQSSAWAASSATDLAIKIEGSAPAAGASIDGGTDTVVSAGWGVIGFALLPAAPVAVGYQPRHGFVNHSNPGVLMQGIRRAWHRRRSGIFVPELWTPGGAVA